MTAFERVYSGAPWEAKIGYCRALRAGQLVFVTGTASVDEQGRTFAPGDGYQQARRCCEIIQRSLAQLGVEMRHVVRTRMFVTDIRRWEEFGRAHREFFGEHPPCTTMVEIKSLINPEMLIEIEVDAVCS